MTAQKPLEHASATTRWHRVPAIAGAALVVAISAAPGAVADADPNLVNSLTQARAGTGCAALRYSTDVERAAAVVNRSTFGYLTHTAENVPADGPDPIAIVNEFGVGSGTAVSLQSAGPDVTTAITALLLQGYKAVPDCSYTDFGVDARYDPGTRQQLLVAILVGK